MADGSERPLPHEWLHLYPDFLAESLVEDEAFCKALGIEDVLLLTVGKDTRFRQAYYCDVLRAYHAGDTTALLHDVDGKSWKIADTTRNGRAVLELTHGSAVLHALPYGVLHPARASRIEEFELLLDEAGLWRHAMEEWRAILEARQLTNEEVRKFSSDLETVPLNLAMRIMRSLRNGEGEGALIAPPDALYYTHLAGAGIASDLAELTASVVHPHIENLLQAVDPSAASMALTLSIHANIIAGSAMCGLPDERIVDLLQWASSSGDLFSRVGAIELGLSVLPRIPSLEGTLIDLVRSILDEDPDDAEGRLALLSGVLIFIGGELSRTRALAHYPPIQRRLAQFAQAAFFERTVFGRLEVSRLAEWARQNGLQRFHFQTMIDRRLEPRWTSDYASPRQLKAEMVGRLLLAAGDNKDNIPDGALRDLLLGAGADGLASHVQFPQSHLPGPLEGRMPDDGPRSLPEQFERMLNEALEGDTLEPKSVTALINLCSIFVIDREKVERAVELIRAAGHRFDASVDDEKRRAIFNGLARLASETRNGTLAEELRLMVHKDRLTSKDGPYACEEFQLALNAASAFEEKEEWATYLGDWSTQLAFMATGDEARQLAVGLDILCSIDPWLRRKLGPANAALASAVH